MPLRSHVVAGPFGAMSHGRFSTRRALAAAAALLLGACATQHRAPRTHTEVIYDCSETIESADGSFEANHDSVGWSFRLPDGMTFGGSLRLIGDEDIAGFSTSGFAGRRFVFFSGFADRFDSLGERNRRDGGPQGTASAFRIGRSVRTEWVPINMVDAIEWAELEELLRDTGDLEILLYDVSGSIHQRATVPRDVLLSIEPTLRAMHARVLERLSDADRLCRREEVEVGEEIRIHP